MLGGDSWDWVFAGGVDGQDGYGIGLGESLREVFEEVAGAGVAVGLEEDVDLAVAAFAGGG